MEGICSVERSTDLRKVNSKPALIEAKKQDPGGAQEFAALITLRKVLEVVLKTRGLGESLCKKQSGP